MNRRTIWGAIMRAALLDLLRRRDLAVAGIFMLVLLMLLGLAHIVGVEDAATATLLLNLSLTLSVGLAHLITVVMAARQFPEEIEQRTLYPLLARPLQRTDILIGKWSACVAAGVALFLVLSLLILLLAPRMANYSGGTLAQLIILQVPALMCTAALGLFFSLVLPRGLALLTAGALVFGTGYMIRLGRNWAPLYLLPDPSRLNLVLRYTDGIGPLAGPAFFALVAAALLWTGASLMAATVIFERKNI